MFQAARRGGQQDIGHYTTMLGAVTVDSEKLGNGHLELAQRFIVHGGVTVQVNKILHSALAVRGLTDDETTAIILDSTGENFGSGGAVAIDQYRQRADVGDAIVRIGIDAYAAAGIAHLYDRPSFYE